jgi:hypothetical protein
MMLRKICFMKADQSQVVVDVVQSNVSCRFVGWPSKRVV